MMLSVHQLARNGQYRSAKLAGGQCLRSPHRLEICGDPNQSPRLSGYMEKEVIQMVASFFTFTQITLSHKMTLFLPAKMTHRLFRQEPGDGAAVERVEVDSRLQGKAKDESLWRLTIDN